MYAKIGGDKKQHIFLSRVYVGKYAIGKKNMRVPPYIEGMQQRRYHSTVDNFTKPTIFVTYHDAQAYPGYLITFKKR